MMKTMTGHDLLDFLSRLPHEQLKYKVKIEDEKHPDGWVSVKHVQAHRIYYPEVGKTEEVILLESRS